MKKIRLKRSKKVEQERPTRITNETVAEHRERILAGGRKFKYPHQYVKHKLVINAIIIGVVALIIVAVSGWLALYKFQNTSDFMYRVTRVVPVPVASVDGAQVQYSDYLMRYHSVQAWLQNNDQGVGSGTNDVSQLNFYKRKVLDGLEQDVYAQKLAPSLNVSVSDGDVQKVIDNNRNTATGRISQEVYDASTMATLGYSPDEYRRILSQSLLRQKVAYAVDTQAKKYSDEIAGLLGQKKPLPLDKIQAKLKSEGAAVELGASGLVPNNNQDGGLTQEALKLKNGQMSPAIKSTNGDGYYFVLRVTGNDNQVSYQYLKVPLTKFDSDFSTMKSQHKIHEYISIPNA